MSEGFPYRAVGGLQLLGRKSLFVSTEHLPFSGGVASASTGQLPACQPAPERHRESSSSINHTAINQT